VTGRERIEMRRYSLFLPSVFVMIFMATAPLCAFVVSEQGVGEQRVLVIMAKFPDVQPSFSIKKMQNKYFDKLDRYLKAVSYQKAWVTGKTTHWYTLPHRVARYRISQRNLAVDREKVTKLIQDAINLADEDEDFSQYSMIFISLGAKGKEYGMMGLCGYPGMLGWQSQLPVSTKSKRQKIPGGVAIYCENAHVGVVFHDMAHIMGGVRGQRRVLPCFYDHDLQAQPGPFRGHYQFYLINVGFFDPMSCHFYKFRQGPPGVCAWTKLRLGWMEPANMIQVSRGASKKVRLAPLSRGGSQVVAVRLPIDAPTYYLIENRQPIGPDRNLPSHGVLIYYCDDRIAECRHGKSPVKLVVADPSVPELKGAPFILEGKNIYRDEKLDISIRLVAKRGENYEIYVSSGE
jgi:M6 family metalloprotease-like protein